MNDIRYQWSLVSILGPVNGRGRKLEFLLKHALGWLNSFKESLLALGVVLNPDDLSLHLMFMAFE